MSEPATYALIGVLVLTQVFWAWNTSRLLDRLMSRDYGDLVRVNKFKALQPRPSEVKAPDFDDDYAANQATRANTLMAL